MKERSIGLAILFIFLTFGIYGIYWFVKLTNETNELTQEKYASGGVAILFIILTFGIYGIYWAYSIGKKANKIENTTGNDIICLICALFGLTIVANVIGQSALNKAIAAGKAPK